MQCLSAALLVEIPLRLRVLSTNGRWLKGWHVRRGWVDAPAELHVMGFPVRARRANPDGDGSLTSKKGAT